MILFYIKNINFSFLLDFHWSRPISIWTSKRNWSQKSLVCACVCELVALLCVCELVVCVCWGWCVWGCVLKLMCLRLCAACVSEVVTIVCVCVVCMCAWGWVSCILRMGVRASVSQNGCVRMSNNKIVRVCFSVVIDKYVSTPINM